MQEKLPCLELNRYADKRLREQHPWVFSNEIQDMKRLQRQKDGALAEVLDCHGNYVATGFVNSKSLIAIRVLSRNREELIDQKFFERRLEKCLAHRENIYGVDASYRLCFGESDFLPGLIIDRFQGVFVVEPHALGMDLRKDLIVGALLKVLEKRVIKCDAIVWRTDTRSAALEGITVRTDLVFGKLPQKIYAQEDSVQFPVDPMGGQKTGFFFDQRENRTSFSRWVRNKAKQSELPITVLDLYCHLGAWGLRALHAGASRAVFVDQSEQALASVKEAAEKMGLLDRCEFHSGDALEFLKKQKAKSFDAIALDPPAFITSKKVATQGLKAYEENNYFAALLVKDGGILSTSSCSYHCLEERFEELVGRAVRRAFREGQILERGGAAWDHPSLAGVAETRYLKNLLLSL